MIWRCCGVTAGTDRSKLAGAGSGTKTSGRKTSGRQSATNGEKSPKGINIGIGRNIGIGLSTEQKFLGGLEDAVGDATLSKREASREASRSDGAKDAKDDLMPFNKKSKRKSTSVASDAVEGIQRRRSVSCMQEFLSAGDAPEDDADGTDAVAQAPGTEGGSKLEPVTKDNVKSDMAVVRGPDWRWGEEDGGTGQVGQIFAFDPKKQTLTVFWHTTSHVGQQYRCDGSFDLAVAPDATVQQARSPGGVEKINRRNSQFMFSMKMQTVIIFDWDDTLFPTTYIRDDMELNWQKPMKDQRIDFKEKAEITMKLDKCAQNVIQLMKMACGLGKVILVTLAKTPWVTQSCTNFFSKVGDLIEDLEVPIVYAQTGIQVDYDKMAMASCEEIEKYWSGIKGKAIANQVKQFYSQYEGQSWKNIISIGDSDFERLGTQAATAEYMKQTGLRKSRGDTELEVDGHIFKVRTKTFKLVDQPTIDELTVEVSMLQKWLPLMVKLDTSFDVNLSDVEDTQELKKIYKLLRGS